MRGRTIFLIAIITIAVFCFIFYFNKTSVSAAFAGWGNITVIYYNPTEDEPVNKFMEQAAVEIRDHLAKVGKTLVINTTSKPASGAIYLQANSSHPELSAKGDESFKLYTDSNGLYITGKTPIAVRHGAYALLEKLGFRWFFKHSAWWTTPNTLINLDLNEVQEPDFFSREFGFYPNVDSGESKTSQWVARNRMGGAKWYRVAENFLYIYPPSNYASDPASFCGNAPNYPWQLNPASQNVINAAINAVRTNLNAAPSIPPGFVSKDKLKYGGPPVIPNDGGLSGWANCYANWQGVTNGYYSLLNAVANNIAADYPNDYVLGLSYADYSGVPTQSLAQNILVYLATAFDFSGVGWANRVAGLSAKGIKLGIYDYYDVWPWWKDKPILKLDFAAALPLYYNQGIRAFYAENHDNWGVKGITYYVASKLLWDKNLNIDNILSDFYTKSFGPAASIMQEYFQNPTDIGNNFKRLAQAETLATGNQAILERIRQLEYYQRFYWKYHIKGLANLSNAELQEFYTFVTKIRDISIITYAGEGAEYSIRAELTKRGLTGTQNLTPPTASDAAIWLQEALTYFADTLSEINIYTTPLTSLGNTTQSALAPITGLERQVYFKSDGNEAVTVRIKSMMNSGNVSVNLYGPLTWYNYDSVIATPASQSVSVNKNTWNSITFSISNPGLYRLAVSGDTYIGSSLDVVGKPAGILDTTAKIFWGPQSNYFYVPQNTSKFTFTLKLAGNNATGTLIDPSGNIVATIYAQNSASENYTVNNPTSGLWKFTAVTSYAVSIDLVGIPPFVWHDPKYLLVPAGASAPPPSPPPSFTFSSTDRMYLLRDKTNFLKVSGSDFNLSTDFSVQFLQNSIAVSSFTFQPKDASTLELNFSSAQVNTLPVGFYNLKIVRMTDGTAQTLAKQILVTQAGDIWSSSATDAAEQKRDGKVDLYDVSRMLSKWGSTNAIDLQEIDINPGPGNISQNKIDLYDANKLMANWRP